MFPLNTDKIRLCFLGTLHTHAGSTGGSNARPVIASAAPAALVSQL